MKTKTLNRRDGEAVNISRFPSFSVTGNITGMKSLYYGKDALLVRCGSYIYHVGNMATVYKEHLTDGEEIYFNMAE